MFADIKDYSIKMNKATVISKVDTFVKVNLVLRKLLPLLLNMYFSTNTLAHKQLPIAGINNGLKFTFLTYALFFFFMYYVASGERSQCLDFCISFVFLSVS